MTSLRKTVMEYVTILLIVVGFAAATTSYYVVKREVNSFQDNGFGLQLAHQANARSVEREIHNVAVVCSNRKWLMHQALPIRAMVNDNG